MTSSNGTVRGTEQFRLITGEVVDAVLLENFITKHPMVHSAIMFGHARYNTGILIELNDAFMIDTNDPNQVEERRNKLQPLLDHLNTYAPQHARVYKEMVLFARPTKPFIYASLGVNRRDTLARYNDEIDALYKIIARTANVAMDPPRVWSPTNALVYVRGIVIAVLCRKLDDHADFFDHGTDSLQATRIRLVLFHALRTTTKMDTRQLTGNIIHQYPTIAGLAAFATRIALASFRERTKSSLTRCLEMTQMAESHSLHFPVHQPSMAQPDQEVVLITGTTGLLGSNLLAQFLRCPKIARVYALNSKKARSGSLTDKQASLLQACGLDPALAGHPKLTLLNADASRSYLGVPQEVYTRLLCSVTHIVHNAWLSTRDDNFPLGIFDGSFRMLRNLVNFALSSPLPTPPRFIFISTIDTLRGAPTSILQSTSERLACEGPASACDAAGNTYTESKWVGEQILAAAASGTSLRPIIVRLGPLCGASNGRWREDALLPIITHLGVTLGALPRIDEVVHWMPVHVVAQAIADMRHVTASYLHVTHPHPVSSLALLRTIGTTLHLPLVSLSEWTAQLEDRVHAAPFPTAGTFVKRDDPALSLLRHLYLARNPTAIEPNVFNHVQIAPSDTCFAAGHGSCGDVPVLGGADIQRWLQHWREVGIIPAS